MRHLPRHTFRLEAELVERMELLAHAERLHPSEYVAAALRAYMAGARLTLPDHTRARAGEGSPATWPGKGSRIVQDEPPPPPTIQPPPEEPDATAAA